MDRRPATWPRLAASLLLGAGLAASAHGEDPLLPAANDPAPAAPAPSAAPPVVAPAHASSECDEGGCCPPTTAQKVFIGVGDIAILLLTLFLFVGLMERRFINTDRSAQLGRHLGISLSLFLTAIGVGALAYLVTGCWPPEFTLWVVFAGVVWVIHGLYTLIAVRGN